MWKSAFPGVPGDVRYTTAMDTPVNGEVVLKALHKIVAAIEGVGHKPVAIGAVARRAWGAKMEPRGVELLLPTGAGWGTAVNEAVIRAHPARM